MNRKKFTLRLTQALQAQLGQCAQENGRSLNAEIVQRLQASLSSYRR